MPLVNHEELRELTTERFERAGALPEEARIVADHLVDSNLCGHDSHGVVRVPGYVRYISRGVTPSSGYEIVRETPATAVIDAGGGLGAVAARRAMEMAMAKASERSFGAVGLHHCGHTGRLGDYPPRANEQGLIGACLLNGGGKFVAPFGGVEGRLPPNPFSVGIPRRGHPPILLDMTSSVVAGGKVDLKRIRGEQIPEGWMIDREGNWVSHVDETWLQTAAVLPLGGLQFGHKGFGMGIVIDCLAGGLTRAGCSAEQITRGGSGFIAIAINIADFVEPDEFLDEVERLVEWTKSSRLYPGCNEILMPGEFEWRTREQRLQEGIPVDEPVWRRMTNGE